MVAFRLGLIINPISGLGGSVGLKGSDTPEIIARARALGAIPQSPVRATQALKSINTTARSFKIFAASGNMGETTVKMLDVDAEIINRTNDRDTSAADTLAAAACMADIPVDLILFAGGDGTARDLVQAIGSRVPVVGIPAGVKMHSAVFATHPMAAARIVRKCMEENTTLCDLEVMDIDEAAYREGAVSANLYGYLKVPYYPELVQGTKTGGVSNNKDDLASIANCLVELMVEGRTYIFGPGTTMRAVANKLGIRKTLLGVDIIKDGNLLVADASEKEILEVLSGDDSIVVTPIGGQGHFFGRGNQQISASIISSVGLNNVIVVATPEKIASLRGNVLHVDTGDAGLDESFCGWRKVITGFETVSICRVSK